MLFSKLFAPTLKEPPKDAVLKSHKHLAQAGYIYQVGSGIYNFLPLAKKVLDKIENITHKRMQEHRAKYFNEFCGFGEFVGKIRPFG